MTALGKRAVAFKGWRWIEGMADADGRLVVTLCHDGAPVWYDAETVAADDPGAKPLPDLDDPATLGCIEHGLLPEAWGGACIDTETWFDSKGIRHWSVCVHQDDSILEFTSTDCFAACLVAALEASQ